MSLVLAIESPDQAEVTALLDCSDAYMATLYPPEGNFAVDLHALMQDDISFVVARLDGRAAGCGAIKWLADGTAELKRIFVAEDARGRGLGGRIMDFLETLARDRNVRHLFLETGPLNTEAVQMYRTRGFSQCGPFADYEDNPYSLFMTRDMTAGATSPEPVKQRVAS
ncbi:GNAT family N-acetyltransferase [Martelella alba]|uniref:GNAT family N-acetyltransferase n=1 Tax=Martelella alba TaxID=2590451 RepID=UPI0015E871F6|nr:GNAT family N-acetyltransferase [Martelella alba]